MPLITGVNFFGPGTATTVGFGDDYLLPADRVVMSTGASAIVVQGDDPSQFLFIAGSIAAGVHGINLNSAASSSLSVTIDDSGSITAAGYGIAAQFKATIDNQGIVAGANSGVAMIGGGKLTNSGFIKGAIGVYDSSSQPSIIDNSGGIVGESSGVYALAASFTAVNSGLISGNASGILVHSDFATITNTATGSITGTTHAVDLSLGAHVQLNNSGTIRSTDDAIHLDTAGTKLTLVNSASGKIISDDRAVYAEAGTSLIATNAGTITADDIAFSTGSGAKIELTNSGTITSTTTLSFFGDSGIDKVTNKGTMRGDVRLSLNNDLYEGNGGRVIGKVEGQSGNDTLRGGSLADTLDGGTENDILVGRGGNDTLTGGTGSDKFYFSVAPNSVANKDTITDFSLMGDTIHLSKAVFAAITQGAGTLQSKFYWESSTGLAHDSDDRIIYNTTTGVLSYDSNGNAAGGAVQIAVLSNRATIGTTLSNADFIVF